MEVHLPQGSAFSPCLERLPLPGVPGKKQVYTEKTPQTDSGLWPKAVHSNCVRTYYEPIDSFLNRTFGGHPTFHTPFPEKVGTPRPRGGGRREEGRTLVPLVPAVLCEGTGPFPGRSWPGQLHGKALGCLFDNLGLWSGTQWTRVMKPGRICG